MIPFRSVLGDEDREHVRRIMLRSATDGGETGMVSKVGAFLRDRAYFSQESVAPLQALGQEARERLISDFVWRVTCYLDGSITHVEDVDNYDLSSGYTAVLASHEGKEYMTIFAPGATR